MSRFMHNEPEVTELTGDQKIFVASSAGNKQITDANLAVSTKQAAAIAAAKAEVLANDILNTKTFLNSLPKFADQAAATAGGLVNNDYYRSAGAVKFVEVNLSDAAIFWFRGNEASGNLIDSSANSLNFTANNAPLTEFQEPYAGRKLVAASSQYFELASSIPSLDRTIHLAAHIYMTGGGGTHRGIITQGTTTGDERALFFTISNTNKLRLHVSADGTSGTQSVCDSVDDIPLNEWVFVEAYYDATLNELGVAINGGLYNTLEHTGGIHVPTVTDLEIGRVKFATNTFLDGAIRHVGAFDRRLFPEERQALFNSGNPANYPFE